MGSRHLLGKSRCLGAEEEPVAWLVGAFHGVVPAAEFAEGDEAPTSAVLQEEVVESLPAVVHVDHHELPAGVPDT